MLRHGSNNKKIKHSSLSIVITVLVIVFVILFNTFFSKFANAFLWYFDMTDSGVFTLSDEAKELLENVSDEVNIYFAQEKSKLMSGDGSNQYMKYIFNTALELEKEFDNINVECVDVVKHPAFFDYYYNTAATDILTTSVIVESNGEFRLFSSDAFFVWDENRSRIWGYNGEAKFAAAILQVTASETPVICFTEGHGEKSPDECAAFRTVCENAGYEVRTIDLSKDEIDDSVRIIIVNDPVYDLVGIEGGETGNEIDKLGEFLENYGCLMVFADSEKSANLTNLSELLVGWGIAFNPGQIALDKDHSMTVDGKTLVAEYGDENSLGASIYSPIAELSSMPKTIVPNAMPLTLLFEKDSVVLGTSDASPALYAPDSSEVLEDGETSHLGRKPLMILTRRESVENNDYMYSYVLACGSPDFVSDKLLNSNSYANSDILLNTIRLTGREKVVVNLDLKPFDDTTLDITVSEANRWMAVFAIAIPAVIAAIGIAVHIRRRRS